MKRKSKIESDLMAGPGNGTGNRTGSPGAAPDPGPVATGVPPPSGPSVPPPSPSVGPDPLITDPLITSLPTSGSGAELITELAATLSRFIFASDAAITAASLFVLHTYAFDLGDLSPVLFITGARRSGKSKFLNLLSRLVSQPFVAASAAPAALYRLVETSKPTLCLDDVDTFVRNREQLRALLKSSTRDTAFHLAWARGADKQHALQRFPTWTPKLFSGLDELADLSKDHAIILPMTRRPADQLRENLLHRTRFDDLRRQAVRFVQDHQPAIRSANPSLPDGLFDHAADHWTPLLAIADLAGGDWPQKARQAAVALSGGDGLDPSGETVGLLTDLRQIFLSQHTNRLASKDLADHLAALEGRPWAEFGKSRRPITPHQVADLLRKIGISPRTVRIGDQTPRGYLFSDFDDAFARFQVATVISKCNTATSPVNIDQSAGSPPAPNGPATAPNRRTSPDFDKVRCHPNATGKIEYWLGGGPQDHHAIQLPASDPRSAAALLAELQRLAQKNLTGKSIPPRSAQSDAQTSPIAADTIQTETKTSLQKPPETEPRSLPKSPAARQSPPKPNLFRLPLPRPQTPVFNSLSGPLTGPVNNPTSPPKANPLSQNPPGTTLPKSEQLPTASPPTASLPTASPSPPTARNPNPYASMVAEPSVWELAINQLQQLMDPSGGIRSNRNNSNLE